ncbi:phosphomannose isomerase type II C-terminal cupin domain [Limobrevibacterium gyesilva]|uniref:Phosphomannose isomerase type II C-terminal cupin domain n=1 Tax=Limobrevibacterium gyesilva TaxID=2991712 RepID=A0AA41YMB2_9PROT|nr:phosphomannose isomerase type II C-terminal cupin domain [Limobrevibacterium gyesilva]MCW3475350.1 phosphomannose isomerase type II C-terminal cupin domain [Limobrevibacterium gyesilva]
MTGPASANTYAAGQSDRRPWGEWAVLDAGPGYVVKRIRVIPGGILSLQRHRHRAEDWTIVAGAALATLGTRQFELAAGQSTHIDTGAVHRIANPGTTDMVFIEVQTGPILSEDDIERLEDSYGRI